MPGCVPAAGDTAVIKGAACSVFSNDKVVERESRPGSWQRGPGQFLVAKVPSGQRGGEESRGGGGGARSRRDVAPSPDRRPVP